MAPVGRSAPAILTPLFLCVLATPARANPPGDLRTTDTAGRVSIRTYDAAGQLVSVTDARGTKVYAGHTTSPTGESSGKIDAPASRTLPAAASTPTTIRVPADRPTIQAAINAAANGDTVLVGDGHYVENINFNGKAIKVTSAHGASKTSIDGGGAGSVVTFNSGETANSVLDGFTITNGLSMFQGGGIYVAGAMPTITRNVITQNAACEGAGVAVQGGGPLIQGNIITGNVQAGCSGGTGGGGIGIVGASSGTPTRIIGNEIANNIMPDSGIGGGGISLFAAGAPLIENNLIEGNDGGYAGGGLAVVNDASPLVVQNRFIHNSASEGGGVHWLIPVSSPGLVLVNNTIAENSSPRGSAIFDGGFDDNMTIENNLVIGQPGQTAYFCQQFNGQTAPAVFADNDVFAAGAPAIGGNCAFGTGGNLAADPEFINTAASDFHLQARSPAIAAGNRSAPDLPQTDLDGFARIENGGVDIGAYEFFPTSIALRPSSLVFPAQRIGTSSTARPVVVANGGTRPLFLGISVTGDFQQSNQCPDRLAPATSCTVEVSFRPTATGTRTGELFFADNAAGSPQKVLLIGTGRGFPVVKLSDSNLTFGSQALGTTSPSKTVTLTNAGTATLAIGSIVSSGDFRITAQTCGTRLAAHASCAVSVKFKPTALGTRAGTLNINDNAAGSPQSVSLNGKGV